MSTKLKVLISLLIAIELMAQPFTPVAMAESDGTNIEACVKTYTSDFLAFMETIIGFHGFFENFVEYGKDILTRNRCQAYDILMLDSQLDKIKKKIQTAYMSCNTEKIPDLELAYYKTDAEIYYARHVVKTSFQSFRGLVPMGLGYKDLNEIEAENLTQGSLTNRSTLFNDMMDKYSSKVGGESEFKKLFNNIEIKYADRKKTYVVCESGGWEDVGAKIKEMITNWGGVKEGVEALEENVGAGAMEIKRSAMEIKRSAIDNPPSSFGDFLSNTFEMSINGLSPERGINQIINEISGYSVDAPTVGDVVSSASKESDRYQADLKLSSLRAKYEALYMSTTDAAALEFLKVLNELQQTILEGMIYIGETFKCTEKMADRQC